MDKFKEIRPIVLGILKKDNKILVSQGYDEIKKNYFYRCLGGGIEFLETSTQALKREFKEELDIDIKVGKFLGVAENIFTFNGKDGHEIIFFYEIDIDEKDYKEKYRQLEDGREDEAVWVDVNKFINKESIIYPEEMINYIK